MIVNIQLYVTKARHRACIQCQKFLSAGLPVTLWQISGEEGKVSHYYHR